MTELVKLNLDEVHVWRATLDLETACLTRLQTLLSEDERERACRFYFHRDRNRFVAARGILRSILSHYLNLDAREIQLDYGSYGKPFLPRHLYAREIRFNLAHCDEFALYAFAQDREVGIDIERLRPEFPSREIAKRFFSPREVAVLFELPETYQVEAFFNCWTRKEAYIKARGMGLSLPLDEFDVSLAPEEPPALLWVKNDPEESSRWTMRALIPASGYVAGLAVEGEDWRLKCWQWTGANSHFPTT